ncbi:hypothetical protein [Paractinoplanes hotanensis]|uniref:Uncharacterized protein n=1 Tax=Paractinoplanes hotanensis TaxID=2906497 RepID=A0ABT0YAS7_9ACTN|nr:hypothetical protein [Actinoplanes hotanensis]MCM4083151.1 hypothetical protein [Actinoplanes hotanensis]
MLDVRGLLCVQVLLRLRPVVEVATGADLAWRVGANVSLRHLRWLADGSYQALIFKPGLSAGRRDRLVEQARTGQDVPADLAREVRMHEYTVPDRNPDGELIVVVTTLTDPIEVRSGPWRRGHTRVRRTSGNSSIVRA